MCYYATNEIDHSSDESINSPVVEILKRMKRGYSKILMLAGGNGARLVFRYG